MHHTIVKLGKQNKNKQKIIEEKKQMVKNKLINQNIHQIKQPKTMKKKNLPKHRDTSFFTFSLLLHHFCLPSMRFHLIFFGLLFCDSGYIGKFVYCIAFGCYEFLCVCVCVAWREFTYYILCTNGYFHPIKHLNCATSAFVT